MAEDYTKEVNADKGGLSLIDRLERIIRRNNKDDTYFFIGLDFDQIDQTYGVSGEKHNANGNTLTEAIVKYLQEEEQSE